MTVLYVPNSACFSKCHAVPVTVKCFHPPTSKFNDSRTKKEKREIVVFFCPQMLLQSWSNSCQDKVFISPHLPLFKASFETDSSSMPSTPPSFFNTKSCLIRPQVLLCLAVLIHVLLPSIIGLVSSCCLLSRSADASFDSWYSKSYTSQTAENELTVCACISLNE